MHKGRVHTPPKPQNNINISPTSNRIQHPTSMDSLAAAAVAMAEKDADQARRKKATSKSSLVRHINRSEETAAATMGTDALLEAAAVLQPVTTSPSACPSSAPTTVTDVTDNVSSQPETHQHGEAPSVYKYSDDRQSWRLNPCTIVENSA